MIYNIEINLPDNMGPMAINNYRLAANKGAVVVKELDKEAKFEDDEEDEAQLPHHPLLFHFLQQRLPTFGTHHNLAGV